MRRLTSSLIVIFTLLLSSMGSSQSLVPFYNQVAGQVSQANISQDLASFQSFGIKYRGTAAQANALNWLKNKYLEFGYTASQIAEDPFTYGGTTCKNLVVTKIGTTFPNTFVIIDGHYDTVGGPGVNDNGSGTAVILEIARLLKNIPTQYSIKFIHFAGEEDGLIGSQHFVENVVNATNPKMDIRVLVNLDQVGGIAGEVNNTITCERDESNSPFTNNAASSAKTTELANCMELYSVLETEISYAYASDYIPFENNGEIITGLFETNESPFPHGPGDTLDNMDPTFVYNVAQGMTGAALHFAGGCTNCNLSTAVVDPKEGVTVYPNPVSDVLSVDKGSIRDWDYALYNVLGQKVLSGKFGSASAVETIATDQLQTGMYVLKLTSGNIGIDKKISVR